MYIQRREKSYLIKTQSFACGLCLITIKRLLVVALDVTSMTTASTGSALAATGVILGAVILGAAAGGCVARRRIAGGCRACARSRSRGGGGAGARAGAGAGAGAAAGAATRATARVQRRAGDSVLSEGGVRVEENTGVCSYVKARLALVGKILSEGK